MGWTYGHATHYKNGKVDRKAECDNLLTYTSNTRIQTVLKSSMKGTTYYAAVETIKDGNREVWAAVILTGSDGAYYNFGYKDMDETMHPYKYDCPVTILNMLTPTDNVQANEWRAKCREQAKKAKEGSTLSKLPIGTKVKWTCGLNGEYRILTKHAPAYQFKTWFWFDEGCYSYVAKNEVNDTNTEIISA